MELGGNDAALVLRDAPIGPRLVRELIAGVFGLSGQLCYGVKRIYVDAGRLDEFTGAFTEMADRARAWRSTWSTPPAGSAASTSSSST
jgi:aldehyde dehydrogenase